ncbi:arsenic resistance protein [Dorea formicigenerans]|uniref:Arsenic resistance protein n=1 Tax=Dorea formicigenerans TaxID=39486 RepID=A0A395XKU7_9FIRM|nr:arsenic resistance protein [Dorea formicigenerans]RGR57910.1 arsenic resistance protein [Dorea formicigenerans]RGW49862.1 arsenic resistance protein [Dorea formicigenerans]RHA01812.1 arsenic resistance protein [Dorea formicigenerans]RHA68525.1 arsenic resistance protein [Dorea formicigenerans]RHB36851.1 arsenic resistance protein [Dorea formicigenerans]
MEKTRIEEKQTDNRQSNSGISIFQKYLTVWVILCMIVGVLIGKFLPAIPAFLNKLSVAGISIPIAILIWIMIYPMMMKVDFQSVKQVATNDLIILVAFVPTVKFLLGVSNVSVPYSTLFLSVFLFVVIPLVGGVLTRVGVIKSSGQEYFENIFVHKFDNATTIGLLLTLVIIFASQTEVILSNPLHIILIAVPLIIQTCFIFAIAYASCKILKLPHDIAAPAGMIGASNFFELAVAVAIALFGTTSAAALATTVGVLTEVPVMLFLVRIANKTKKWFQ